MPVRKWVRDHSAEGRVAHRVAALLGDGEPVSRHVARLEQPGRFGDFVHRLGHQLTSRLGHRLGLRVDPGRRAAAAVGIAALVAVLIAGAFVLANRPHSVALAGATVPAPSVAGSVTPATSSRASPSASPSTVTVVVDVVGKVANPGVYRLPAGSRVDDALKAAGGVLPGVDLTSLNRAQLLSDGQQVAVGVAGAVVGPGSGGASGAPSGPINLNTATADQLDALPGVGPVLAQHIIAWRTQHGSFTSVDQLREVSGIGEAKFADLKSLVTV